MILTPAEVEALMLALRRWWDRAKIPGVIALEKDWRIDDRT
jgi:hypothetical protein